ncbi:MAG TPA: porin [Kofleriaceae bacterium]|nr:porin [Kofleriaceae bacterium]
MLVPRCAAALSILCAVWLFPHRSSRAQSPDRDQDQEEARDGDRDREPAADADAEVDAARPRSPAPAASPSDRAPPLAQPAPAADLPDFALLPFGYIRVQGSVVQDDPNVAFVGRADGIELMNARAGVDGRLGERVGFRLSIDGAVDERDQVNDPNGTLRVALRDAFVDLHVLPRVDLRAGRAEPMFDPEEIVGDTRRQFIERALPSRGVRPTDGWETRSLSPGRSLGVAVRSDPGPPASGVAIGYEIAAQNGADEFATDNDNDALAVSAGLLVRLPADGFVLVAGRYNPRTEGELPFQQDETDLQGSAGLGIQVGPLSLGGGLMVERTSFEDTGGPAEQSLGAWGQGLVRLPLSPDAPFALGYRFGYLEPSDLISTDRIMEHTGGAVWQLPAWHLRALLNATLVVEQAARDLSNNRVEAALEVSL